MPPSRLPRNPASSSSLPADVPSGGVLKTHPRSTNGPAAPAACVRYCRAGPCVSLPVPPGAAPIRYRKSQPRLPAVLNRKNGIHSARPHVPASESHVRGKTHPRCAAPCPCPSRAPRHSRPPRRPRRPAPRPCLPARTSRVFMHQTNRRAALRRADPYEPQSAVLADHGGRLSMPQRTSQRAARHRRRGYSSRRQAWPRAPRSDPPPRAAFPDPRRFQTWRVPAPGPQVQGGQEAMRGDATIRTIGFPLSRLFRRRTTLLNIIFYRELSPFT